MNVNDWFVFIRKNWYSPIGLLVALAGSFFIPFKAFGLIFESSPFLKITTHLWVYQTISGIFGTLIIFGLWIYSRRYPKRQEDKIGIVIAIRENTEEARKVKKELIERFTDTVRNSSVGSLIEIIPLEDFMAAKVVDDKSAVVISGKTKSQFVIYGKLVNFGEDYEFDLRYIVRHIPLVNTSLVQQGFNEALVNRNWRFLERDTINGIKATASNIREISLYVIGIAAHQSFDFVSSRNLHQNLYAILKNDTEMRKQLNPVYLQLPKWLADSDTALSIRKYNIENDLSGAFALIEEALTYNASSYSARLGKALFLFEQGNVIEAKRLINSIGKGITPDFSWRYSQAFLFFYEGDCDMGMKCYKKAFYGVISDRGYLDITDHISKCITREPDKIQLHFAIALILIKKMINYPLALTHLENFLERFIPGSNMEVLVPKARELLLETYNMLNIPFSDRKSF